MRRIAPWNGLLAIAFGVLVGIPANGAPPPDAAGRANSPDPHLQAVAREYASSLFNFIAQIEQQYVRPVTTADLAEAALAGLYEVVRQPVPPGLHADLQSVGDVGIMALLRRAREEIGDHDALRGTRALRVSLNALPRALDPYCGLIGAREFQSREDGGPAPFTGAEFQLANPPPSLNGLLPGGVRFGEEPTRTLPTPLPVGPMRIVTVHPGSPAQKAGVRPGDLVVAVDEKRPEDPGFGPAFQRLLPLNLRAGVPVDFRSLTAPIKLRLLRPGRPEPLEVTLVPADYRTEAIFGARRRPDGSWDFLLDPGERIGYLRIGQIQMNCHHDVAAAIQSLRSPTLGGLILDLRWCPGGFLDESASIARMFLAPGQLPVALERDRSGRMAPVDFTPVEIEATDFPIVVLVNGETSGGGELIAAALQDHGRAVVAGQRTVGKSSVQSKERSGLPFKITTKILIRPSKRNASPSETPPADDWVVRPDSGREVPASAELSRQLKSWWMLHTLRPAGSTEALPLDDPENDPQRQAAVQMLRQLMGK